MAGDRYGDGARSALFLLDEPVAGMTGREREKPLNSCSAWHKITPCWLSSMTWNLCGRPPYTVLHEGAVLCEGSVDRVQQDPRVIEVYLGRGYHADAQGSGA